jgi:hypothetical protein
LPLAAAAAAALLAAGGLQAAEPAAPAPQAAEDARLKTIRLILEITNPYDQMVEANMVGWEAATRKAISLDSTAASLEKAYPGLSDAVVEAGRPTARAHLGKIVREMLAHKEQVLVRRLTAAELDEVLRFFRTDPGRRAIRGLYANVDPAGIASDVAIEGAKNGEAVLTADEVARIEQAAAAGMMALASAEDKAAIVRFSRSAASRKFTAASSEADAKLIEMTNNPNPDWLARQSEIMRAAALAFIAAKTKG